MRRYDDFTSDFAIILLYEFLHYTRPIWYSILMYLFNLVMIYIKKIIYIPKQSKLNVQKVIVLYDNQIILYNILNLNYYHIKIKINDTILNIIGNDKYILMNHMFCTFNIYSNYLITPDKSFSIYILPIKLYELEECCVCFMNPGTLVGLCGHQNICNECINVLNKCPICNNHLLFKNVNNKMIKFINS